MGDEENRSDCGHGGKEPDQGKANKGRKTGGKYERRGRGEPNDEVSWSALGNSKAAGGESEDIRETNDNGGSWD